MFPSLQRFDHSAQPATQFVGGAAASKNASANSGVGDLEADLVPLGERVPVVVPEGVAEGGQEGGNARPGEAHAAGQGHGVQSAAPAASEKVPIEQREHDSALKVSLKAPGGQKMQLREVKLINAPGEQ
jgi:hypothetical protein